MSKADATVQHWTFGGTRLFKNERRSEWVGKDHKTTYWYKHRGGRFVVGSEYEVLVDSDMTMYGTPTYVGRSADQELITSLAAQHRAAELAYDRIRRERRDKANDPLELAINELATLIQGVPAPQRAGLIHYITYKLSRVW